jgi:vitamin B12 transporter
MFVLLHTAVIGICQAQKGITDSTVVLKPVNITAGRLEDFGIGNRIEKIDSLTLRSLPGSSAANLFLSHSEVYIKTYGCGALGTVSIRGTSAAHTAVLWNGFNLQSPMNGTMDLALLPVNFTDDIRIQYGGSGALFGSGAVGGTILLNNQPAFGSGINTSLTFDAGSFMNLGGQAALEIGTARTYTSVRAFYHQGINDFPFINPTLPGSPEAHQTHAALKQYGMMAGEHLLIGKKQKLSINLWQLNSTREIPPLMTQPVSRAKQDDQSLRGSAEWQYAAENVIWFLRTAVISEIQHYTDSFPTIDSHNDFLNSITEFESRIKLGKRQLLNTGVNNSFEQVKSDNYTDTTSRDRVSLFANYRYKTLDRRWAASFSLREEYSGVGFLPIVPSTGAECRLWKGAMLKAAASRIYRLPTLNDLFWYRSGNPDLRPENGWSEEAGLSQELSCKNLSTSISLTVYNSNITDWIIWLPSDTMASIWIPKNIMEVWGRGGEFRLSAEYSIRKWKLSLNGGYNLSRSTNRKAKTGNDASIGKQLIYTPLHTASLNLSAGFLGFILSYNHHVTGSRYTSSDNSSSLPAFHTGNMSLAKNIRLHSFSVNLSFAVENLWNQKYQAVAWMPMPGRVYKGSISFAFHKPFKNKK